jgi:Domain of unknown function (DUF4386)
LSFIAGSDQVGGTCSIDPIEVATYIRFDTSVMSYSTTTTKASWTRAVALAGLASFVLIIVAAFVAPPLWDAPGTTASGADVAAHVQDNRGRTIASLFIYSLSMGLFLCFTAGLSAWLREREPRPQPLAATFAFGAVALAVLILAGFVPIGVLAYRPQDPDLAQALRDVTFGVLALSGVPTAVCLGAYAALVLRRRCLPGWTAWLAVIAVLAHLFIVASFMSHGGLLSLEGSVIVWVPGTFFAWILAASVALLRLPVEGY